MTETEKQNYQSAIRYVWDDTSVIATHKDNTYYARFRCQQVLSEAQETECQDWQWKLSVSTAEMERRGLL